MSGREVNQKEFAAIIGLTPRRVRDLEDLGLPYRSEGRRKFYPIPDAVQWYIDRKREEDRADVDELGAKEAKARRERVRARKAEIELAKIEGDLVTREAADRRYGEILDRIRTTIMNMPGRYGAQMGFEDPRDGERALQDVRDEVLDHVSGPAADAVEVGASVELPDDFPGRDKLLRSGAETVADVMEMDDLQDVHGIGPVTARAIQEALDDLLAA